MGKSTRRTTDADRQQIADMYRAGASWEAIIRTTGWSVTTVHNALERAGLNGTRSGKRSETLRHCEVCGATVRHITPARAATGAGRFCSVACMGVAKRLPGGTVTDLQCHRCRQVRPVGDFNPHATNARGYQYWCKPCARKERAERAKVPMDPHTARRYSLWSLYRITVADYDRMHEQQGGRCGICRAWKEPWTPAPRKERQRFLVVDHDHRTGRVRGLLCWNCNCGIGQFMENPAVMFAAAAYLDHEAAPGAQLPGLPVAATAL